MEYENLSDTDNLYVIAKSIFTKRIQKPKFYSLQLEPENEGNSLEIANSVGLHKYIQSLLSLITVNGIEILYSHRDINILTESQLNTVKMYVKSYGYIIDKKDEDSFWHFTCI